METRHSERLSNAQEVLVVNNAGARPYSKAFPSFWPTLEIRGARDGFWRPARPNYGRSKAFTE